MRMNASTGFALCASITSLVFVGCSQWPGGRDKPAINRDRFISGSRFSGSAGESGGEIIYEGVYRD
jgi:hypothetical protein